MALLKVIEWADNSSNTLVYKVDTRKNVIKRGSALTVREGQVAVFCDKGRMADVFQPGYYKLDTDSLPILTSLLSWKYKPFHQTALGYGKSYHAPRSRFRSSARPRLRNLFFPRQGRLRIYD